MAETARRRRESVERALSGYLAAGGTDEHGMRSILEDAHEQESFLVGDEVVCAHGGLVGVVLAINGPDALISWACRGKSVEHLIELKHADHAG